MSNQTVHLLRTAAGVESLEHLSELQTLRYEGVFTPDGQRRAVAIYTRRKPQRSNELLNGGSVYWIIKSMIKARQEILDIEILQDEEGKDFCRIYVDPEIMLTQGISHRAIQGWRYLAIERAPQDIGPFDSTEQENIHEELAKDLREIALI